MKSWLLKLLLACCAAVPAATYSQYPSKPVRIIVGLAAGGPVDGWARAIAEPLSEALATPVLVENRPGAEGLIAAEYVRQSPPDGYTIFGAGFGTLVAAPRAQKSPPFDPGRDFTPISLFGHYTMALFVHPGAAGSLSEFMERVRTAPGAMNYATSTAIDSYLYAQLMQAAGGSMTRVQYKGAVHSTPDLLAGRVHASILPLSTAFAHANDGRLRVLATFGSRRAALAPDVPTLAEAGMTQISSPTWMGIFGPANMPREILDRLSRELSAILNRPGVHEKLERQSLQAEASTPRELGALVKRDFEAWRQVTASGVLKAAQ